MKLRGFFGISLIITTILLSSKSYACLVYDDMIKTASSHSIGKGTIVNAECGWNENKREIETLLSIKVDSVMEDGDGEVVDIVVPGGVLTEEGIALIVSGHDQFRHGDQVTVFAEGNSDYTIRKNSRIYSLQGSIAEDVPRGFTYYCYNRDSLELVCSSDVCESTVYWPREKFPVTYYINSSFSPHQAKTIEVAMETWNRVGTLFNGICGGITEVNEVAPDGVNVIRIADEEEMPDYQLARCYIWTDLKGEIFDADICLNPYYAWGVTGNPGEGDIQNILTHEIGHFIGLGDIYKPGEAPFIPCMGGGNKGNTMYAFSGIGEIKKRTLALGDLIGIQSLYGCAVTIALEGDERALNSIRYFVDSFLIKTEWGKDFIDFYYEISPQFSSYFTANPKMKLRAKNILHAIIPVIETFPSFKETLSE
jgi:hypothetical protein